MENYKKRFKGSRNRYSSRNNPRRSQLKLCTLSGTTEVGRNCSFVEYGNDILMIDAGFSFPDHELYGIDYLIPNINYLKKNRHKIKGILITHGHLDHTGALQYILNDLGNPTIYAGSFANALIKEKLNETDLAGKFKLVNVHRNTTMNLGAFEVRFIGVTHSIPNAFSIFIKSPDGNIFFSGDYKIDLQPENEPETDYTSLKELSGKVDLALMESTNADIEGKSISATEVAQNIEHIIAAHKGRVVIAMFSSLLSRLYSVIKIAEKTNRKLFISGRSLNTALKIARESRYITFPDGLVLNEKQLKDFPDDKVLFICTGSQAERYSALNRISLGEHKFFKIKEGDLILLSASEIPMNVSQIEKMTDRLIGQGADLIKNDTENIHETGHALKLDMKMMYDMVKPKNVMPIHGSLTMRYQNKKNYIDWGMNPNRMYLTTDGQVWVKKDDIWEKDRMIESKPILIDGLGIGDIGDVVLKDRQQLAEYGMVVVILNLSSKNKKIIGNPKFISRGFVYVKTSKALFDEMGNIVVDKHREWQKEESQTERYDIKPLLTSIEKSLAKFIYDRTEREPKILAVTI